MCESEPNADPVVVIDNKIQVSKPIFIIITL